MKILIQHNLVTLSNLTQKIVFFCGVSTLLTSSCSKENIEGSNVSDIAGSYAITGRMSMGTYDQFQCYKSGKYSGPEQVNGRWIAGIDGVSLGTLHDAPSSPEKGGPNCGKIFTITVGSKCENFIVVDRIWENDGAGQNRYNNKQSADSKTNSIGAGYAQLDIAKEKFQSLFNGANPSGGYSLKWNDTCPLGTGNPTQRPSPGNPNQTPSTFNPNQTPSTFDPYQTPNLGNPYQTPNPGIPYQTPGAFNQDG